MRMRSNSVGYMLVTCYVCHARPMNPKWEDGIGWIDCDTCQDSGNQPVPFKELGIELTQ